MLDRIHQSKVLEIMQRRQDGRPLEFSVTYCKRSTGELVTYQRAIFSSVHSAGATVNILQVGEAHPRKIRRCLITHINGMKVYF